MAVLLRQIEQAASQWRDTDHGIWEVRGELQHFTSSKLLCWVALDRGVRLARLHGQADYARKWDSIAEEIHEDFCGRNGPCEAILPGSPQHVEVSAPS